ncbi:Phosphate-specific transport system accessory protein PhoU homolog [Hyella patelloides LEGE 07179]|uniref:Phosphate-specific transport system accessory protein PhoU n=1 Tax=Hyella patelloides LEGE 07179 TaxID=945734 RepID=A0A563VLU4_9CYAN|nr:phosphate signaling complex protein PhoU [Hyella patelloides]VEP12382.1 Phosphate-specific transport system accessory protein PhoU homolog [Hyella patelloides LEGE 07179]
MTLFSQTSNSERTQLKRSVKQVQQDVLRMGTLVEQSFRLSHQCLFVRDIQAGENVIYLEKRIDRYYRQIELDCATLMTLQSPVAQDLRLLSALMQLVRDLERIGDYAQDITEMALKLVHYPPHSCMDRVEAMSEYAQLMLATSLVALADLDAKAGENIKKLDDTVDDAYEYLYDLLAHQRDVPGVVEPILLLGLIIRHLERMADHATNIGQRVSYIVTGRRK